MYDKLSDNEGFVVVGVSRVSRTKQTNASQHLDEKNAESGETDKLKTWNEVNQDGLVTEFLVWVFHFLEMCRNVVADTFNFRRVKYWFWTLETKTKPIVELLALQ